MNLLSKKGSITIQNEMTNSRRQITAILAAVLLTPMLLITYTGDAEVMCFEVRETKEEESHDEDQN